MGTPLSPPTLAPGSGSAVRVRPLVRGELVGERYRVGDKIADGGMGAVYEAVDKSLGMCVAIKLLRPDLVHEPQMRQRFTNEAHAAMSIVHDNVIEIFAIGELEDGTAYYVMELLDGESLARIGLGFARGAGCPRGDLHTIVDLSREICDGLEAAHDKGVIHRDLKPENVFVTVGSHGTLACKLIDFGIAKVPFASALTMPGQVMGTPAYLAPEQALASAEVDHRCDIYALGVMLYELIAGELPFDDDDPMRLALAHVLTAPRPLLELRPDCPPVLADVVMRCLRKNPEERFATAAALEAALAAALEPEPSIEERLLMPRSGIDYGKTVIINRAKMRLSVTDLLNVSQPATNAPIPWWVAPMLVIVVVLLVLAFLG